ncbi:selenocysteine lyase isoform X2 [Cryptotermes secundus]|uniref:selenocysteine lyase isoform X2 n=1 Tax=Cryptotermes secundus TaxID=105785 RepID=UPI000CD7CB74|nr:selenocysteine lyase isoform X2 [Cryptotermes secundus]
MRLMVYGWYRDMAVYLDHNATTPVAEPVVQKIIDSLNDEWGNPSSGYLPGTKSKNSIAEARQHIALMIGGKPEDIIFTSGGTEANNMVIFGIVSYYEDWLKSVSFLKVTNEKPHVITTNVEHDAVILPIRHLEKTGAIDVSIIHVSTRGCVVPQDILSKISHTTCLITVMLANNETGVIMPVEEIGRCIKEVNKQRKAENLIRILYHTDAAQGVGKIQVDVQELNVDYLTVVGHKFYGPRIGCLYARGIGQETPVYPLLHGGGQERGYRPGTENTPMIAGLGEAARLVCENLSTYSRHMKIIRDYLEEELKEAFGEGNVIFNCSKDVRRLPNTCSVSLIGVELVGHVVLSKCAHIMASIGAACHAQNKPSGILLASGIPHHQAINSIRLSVGRETTKGDIDIAIEDLKQSVTTLLYKNSS